MFVMCACVPEPGQDDAVRPQESELDDAKWMPLEEYEALPFQRGVALYDKMRCGCVLCCARACVTRHACVQPTVLTSARHAGSCAWRTLTDDTRALRGAGWRAGCGRAGLTCCCTAAPRDSVILG